MMNAACEIQAPVRVSVRFTQNAWVSRSMDETWQVCCLQNTTTLVCGAHLLQQITFNGEQRLFPMLLLSTEVKGQTGSVPVASKLLSG